MQKAEFTNNEGDLMELLMVVHCKIYAHIKIDGHFPSYSLSLSMRVQYTN